MLVEEMVLVVFHTVAALHRVFPTVAIEVGLHDFRETLEAQQGCRGEARQHEVGARRAAHRGVDGLNPLPDLIDRKDADMECVEADDAALIVGTVEVGPGIIGDDIATHVIMVAVHIGATFEERGAGGGGEMCVGVWRGGFEL